MFPEQSRLQTNIYSSFTDELPVQQNELIVCISDYEKLAAKKLNKTIADYFNQGADEELTLRSNQDSYNRLFLLKPRIMRNVQYVNISQTVFGDTISLPIGISPSALQKMAHPDGEIATVRACHESNSIMVLSLFSTTSLEDVAKEAPICTKWQNIYILKNKNITLNVIRRAERSGYRALVITCDAPVLGCRRRDLRNNFTLGEFMLANINDDEVVSMKEHSGKIFDPSITWTDVEWLKKQTRLKVIVKGIMNGQDAELALKAGVDGIFVSNHGGRQLDGTLSTLEVLPEVIATVAGRCPVFIDGGVRTGNDVLKALALGAKMAFVGRPILWGLACEGQAGVRKVLKILEDELRRAMRLCGCTSLQDIDGSILIKRNN